MSSWKEKWTVLRPLTGGGQGDVYLVAAHGTTEPNFFLKVLRDNRSERRARMRREIACYQTLSHTQIPTLIDSNIAVFDEKEITPYVVTEFINGTNLREYINRNGPLSASDSIQITCRLLEVLHHAHLQETIHRDVKPENIILRMDNPNDPVLVDFGLSFYEGEDHLTPDGQEIGNRFLRLPEFHAGSATQRDHRSDVTQCAGILFFLLTGITPRLLRDENGHMPHQSSAGKLAISRLTGIDILALLNAFDRAFDSIIHARWNSAEVLREKLMAIRMGNHSVSAAMTPEEMITRITAQMEGHEEGRNRTIANHLRDIGRLLVSARNGLRDELGGNFVDSTGGPTINIGLKQVTVMLGLAKSIDYSIGYFPKFVGVLEGDEIILRMDNETVYRGSIERLEVDRIIYLVRQRLLTGITNLVAPAFDK